MDAQLQLYQVMYISLDIDTLLNQVMYISLDIDTLPGTVAVESSLCELLIVCRTGEAPYNGRRGLVALPIFFLFS